MRIPKRSFVDSRYDWVLFLSWESDNRARISRYDSKEGNIYLDVPYTAWKKYVAQREADGKPIRKWLDESSLND